MWATLGRLRSSTRLTLDVHETGRVRSRSRNSRRGELPEAGCGDETDNAPPCHHPDAPTRMVDSPVRSEKKTDQPLPVSAASRRQPSPASGESHQLTAPVLDRAPPPPTGLSAFGIAPPTELPGPGRPCRSYGFCTCGGVGPAGSRRRRPYECPA